MQGHGMVCGIQRKIRHVRCSMYLDPVEPASEVADGMQMPPIPLMVFRSACWKVYLPVTVESPGSPYSTAQKCRRREYPLGHRVGQVRVIGRWEHSGPRHAAQCAELENLWILVRLVVPITSRESSHTISSTTILILPRCRDLAAFCCRMDLGGMLMASPCTCTDPTCVGFRNKPISPA
jgi:hypothetical protein